jgi:hypothetical protein
MMKTCVEGWQVKTRDSIPNMSSIGTIRPKDTSGCRWISLSNYSSYWGVCFFTRVLSR